MDFMRGTVRVINQLETNSRFNGKRGDDERDKNCPKYKWKKMKNHSLFKRICGVFHCKPASPSCVLIASGVSILRFLYPLNLAGLSQTSVLRLLNCNQKYQYISLFICFCEAMNSLFVNKRLLKSFLTV